MIFIEDFFCFVEVDAIFRAYTPWKISQPFNIGPGNIVLWGLSWYFIRTALAIGLAYYLIDRLRRLRQIQRLRALTFRAWLEED